MTHSMKSLILSGGLLTLGAAAFLAPHPSSAETMKVVPPPAVDEAARPGTSSETAILAGGCFWGVQGVFQHVKGVTSAVSGYSGGMQADASYPAVSSGTTGHAESVKITYDPHQVSFGKLLQIYFSVVTDPTILNAQGPDEGTQYRSDIFATNPEQADIATRYIAQLQAAHVYAAPVVTTVTAFKSFYPAETYHQNYLTDHPDAGYIAINDMPKVEGLKALFGADYRQTPALVTASTN
jgi:peptide-methionine (S)-S-oxide reductase